MLISKFVGRGWKFGTHVYVRQAHIIVTAANHRVTQALKREIYLLTKKHFFYFISFSF